MSALRAPYPWFGDAMAYAKAHVDGGVLLIDDEGRIWRTKVFGRGDWRDVPPRRAENVGGKGYLRVSLNVPGHGLAIVMAHRLVFEMKVGPIPDGLQINHRDLDKQNNRPSNLEVVTGAENIQHSYGHGRSKPWSQSDGGVWRPGKPLLTDDQKREAVRLRADGHTIKQIATAIGISMTHAQRITAAGPHKKGGRNG